MPNSHLGGISSDAGIVTRSLATLNQGIVDDQQVTVPCTIKLDKLSQSTEKLQLKDDKGYYTLVKEETQRYTIKDIRILRTRNRSLSGHQKKSSEKMSWPRQSDHRFSHYPPQSSGNKRPFHSPPDDYPKHHRYENKYNRHGFDSRESRGSRHGGAFYSRKDNRGKFTRSNHGSRYPSSEGYHRDNRYDERYSGRGHGNFRPQMPIDQRSTSKSHCTRNNESDGNDTQSIQPKNATHRNVVESAAKTPEMASKERNVRDSGNPKSGGNSIAQNSQKSLSGSDCRDKIKEKTIKGVLTMSEQISLTRQDSRNSECKHRGDSSNCLSDAKSLEVRNHSDSSMRTEQKEPACNSGTKRSSEHFDGVTPSGLRADQYKQEGKQEQEAKSVKLKKTPAGQEDDSTEDGGDACQSTAINVSKYELNESRESNNESHSAVEGVRQSPPASRSQVKVHSARKTAPSSALSRTQRKKMLSRQKLLKSMQTLEKDESGAPKAMMGSRHSDSEERESDKESQKSHTEHGSKCSAERAECDLDDKLTLPSSDAALKSDAKGPAKEGAPVQQSEESKSNSSSEGCVLGESVSKMTDVKETNSENQIEAVKQEEMEILPEKMDSEKATGVKIKDNALQKIKENLKKKLQKSHHLKFPKKEHAHLVDESSSSSASAKAASPEPQNVDMVEDSTYVTDGSCFPYNESEMSLSPVSSIESTVLEDNSEQSSNILDGAKSEGNHVKDTSIPVLPNAVSDVLASVMLDSPSWTVENVNAVEMKQILPIPVSSKAELAEFAEAVTPTTFESKISIPAKLEGYDDSSAENDSSAADPADKSIVLTPVEDKGLGESLSSSGEADLDDISVDLGPEEPDDMNAIDDDILFDDPPEASQDHSEDLEICCIESHSTEVIETESQGGASKRPLPLGDNIENREPVSKKRKEDVDSVFEDFAEEVAEAGDLATGDDKLPAGERPVKVVDLDSEQSTCKAEQSHEEMIGNLDTSGTLVFTQKEWKDLYNSIIDKYKTLIEKFQEKTIQVTEEQVQWKVRYDSLAKDYAELREKYEQLNAHVKENSSTLKRSVDVQTETLKGTLSRMKKRHTKQACAEEIPNQETQAAIVQTTSSGTTSPSTSEHKSDAAGPSSKNSNLESKRQNFQAILSKALQSKNISTPPSEANEVPASLPDHSPSPGIEVPSPNRPHSTSPEVVSGTDPAAAPSKAMHIGSDEVFEDATKQDKVHGPQASESDVVTEVPTKLQEPNAANTASGEENAARLQEPSSHASKAPPSSNDTSTLTKLSSTNQQASSSSTPSQSDISNPTVHSSDTSKGPSVTEPDVPKVVSAAASTSSSSLSSSASSSKTSALPTSASSELSTSVDPSGGKSCKRSDETEIIDLTDEPDPPVSAPASVAAVNLPKPAALPSSKHSTLITRSPHVLVLSPPATASMSKSVTRLVTNSPQSNRVVSSLSQSTASPVQQAEQRPSGTMHGTTRPSPNTPSTVQLMNVNPPAITSMGQGPNIRNQVVTLQHGQVQRVGLNNQATISQGNSSQVLSVAQQQNVGSVHLQNVSTSHPVTSVAGVKIVPNKQGTIRQLTVPQQQQISLQMLQQQRQGIHQLPGAAASAAALATRQPQTTWITQTSQQLPSVAPQQVQIVQQSGQTQINLTPQVQVFKATAASAVSSAQTLTTSALQARPKQFQNAPRGSSTQEQIQAQERARTLSQMQAKESALRQQREQETLQAARQAAARLQSSQVGQQEAQQAQLRKLQEEKLEHQKRAQQSQSRSRMIREHLSKVQEYQRSLKSKLKSLKPQGIDVQELQKQLKDVQEQEKKLSQELALVEERRIACNQQNSKIEQQLRLISTSGLPAREQQTQQFNQHQQLQQRNRLIKPNQADQRQQQSPGQSKHPAELPDLHKLPEVPPNSLYTPQPLKPILEIRHSPEGIVLSWKADPNDGAKVEVKKYLLYAYQESESTTPSTDLWKKIGAVEALPLPMACTLTHFKAGSMYHFAVGAISKHGRPGKFSNIGSINLP